MGKTVKRLEVKEYMNEYEIVLGSRDVDITLFRDAYNGTVSSYSKYMKCESVDDTSDTTLVSEAPVAPLSQHHHKRICLVPGILSIAPRAKVEQYLSYFTAILYKYKVIYPKVFVNWRQLVNSYVLYQCTVLYRGWSNFAKKSLGPDTGKICEQILQRHLLFVSSHTHSIESLTKELKLCLCNRFVKSESSAELGTSLVNYAVWFDLQNGVLLFMNGELSPVIEDKDMTVCSTYGVCIGHEDPERIVKKLLLFCNLALIEYFTSYHDM